MFLGIHEKWLKSINMGSFSISEDKQGVHRDKISVVIWIVTPA